MLRDLTDLGIWSEGLKTAIIANQGSIQDIEGIPQEMKDLYKTVWEISQKTIINMAADRAVFIDQSQSLNLYMNQPNYGKITSMHFYAWEKGLKTGMYYLRTRPAADPIKFTIDKNEVKVFMEQGCKTVVLPDKENQGVSPASEAEDEFKKKVAVAVQKNLQAIACSLKNRDACESCSG